MQLVSTRKSGTSSASTKAQADLEELELDVESGTICVAAQLAGNASVHHRTATALLGVWRWEKFAQERVLALRNTSRTLLAARMTGLQLLSACSRTEPHSEYYPHGAARMNRELLIAIASGPTEEVLAMLLEDDRHHLQLKMMNFTIEQEFEFIDGLSVDVYTYLASFVGPGAMMVRLDVLSVSCASVCFFS